MIGDIQFAKPPFLPKLVAGGKKYTLCLDLDETLVHYKDIGEDEGELLIRPGAERFLELMSKYFEIVIFTAAVQDYADWAIS